MTDCGTVVGLPRRIAFLYILFFFARVPARRPKEVTGKGTGDWWVRQAVAVIIVMGVVHYVPPQACSSRKVWWTRTIGIFFVWCGEIEWIYSHEHTISLSSRGRRSASRRVTNVSNTWESRHTLSETVCRARHLSTWAPLLCNGAFSFWCGCWRQV